MPLLDTLSLLLSFIVASIACCMLLALYRLRADPSLRVKASLPSHLPLRPALRHRPFEPAHTGKLAHAEGYVNQTRRIGYLASRPHTTTDIMFHAAVKNHSAATPTKPAHAVQAKQQNLVGSFKSSQSTQKPLSTLSGNVPKHVTDRHHSGQSHGIGIKRTSGGLAKALGSQEKNSFGYPSLRIPDSEDDLTLLHKANTGQSSLSTVLFDENDFDSDIDLDVEDPATRSSVVQYPSLPRSGTADSAYHSAKTQSPALKEIEELRSSQPIPWSSSPLDHFNPPPKHFKSPSKWQPAPAPTKRRTLPWLQNTQTKKEVIEDELDEELDINRPRKRMSTEAAAVVTATPAPKSNKPDYPWNSTQSAIKQQQKTLRETNKRAGKVNDDDEVKAAMKRRKKSTIHKIFLSEEQQNVLSLVVENKKSVFFTGSAGMMPFAPISAVTDLVKVPVNLSFSVRSSQRYGENSLVSLIE